MPSIQLHRVAFAIAALTVSLLFVFVFAVLRSQANRGAQADETSRQSEQRLQELEAKRNHPGMLLFRAAEFDPLQSLPTALRMGTAQLEIVKPPAVQTEAVEPRDSSYWIVQFADRIKPEQTASLRARGYEIKAYIPNNAFIVKVPRTQEAALRNNREQAFRWTGAYGAGLKVEPELAALVNETNETSSVETDAPIRLAFNSFPGEKADQFKTRLAGLKLRWPVDVIERFDGVTSGLIYAARAELAKVITALAHLEGTEWIEQQKELKPANDNGVKITQAGPGSTDTPLYRHGLTGAGQIIGFVDTGLDTDHAQFRFSADPAAQTLSFATTTQELVDGALPFQVTNPNNKVLTYYVLGRGRKIDNPNNPNGGKVLDPNQRIGADYLNAVAYDDSASEMHGTSVVSVAAGRNYAADGTGAVPGLPTRSRDDGIAPDARIVFQDVGHPAGELFGLDIGQAFIHTQAYSTGVHIHSNSYEYSAPVGYNSLARDGDAAMWRLRDYTIFFAAGNDGPRSHTVYWETKNAILVGSTSTPTTANNPENLSGYSSHGPTLDGRIKPDIVVPGTLRSATEFTGVPSSFGSATSTTALDAAVNPVAPNNNRDFRLNTSTSFACSLAAGGAALVRQYFVEGFYPTGTKTAANSLNPSNALIKAVVLNSGRNLTGSYTATDAPYGESAPLPNSGQGWGRMTLDDVLYFPGDRRELKILADIWNGATAPETSRPAPNPAIMTGQTHTYQVANVSTVEPLRITLVWTDPNATPGASVALVNDLNLEVTDPTGKVYRGNVNFSNAYSQVANGAEFDNRNPLEAVYIQTPNPGTYTVKVIGQNVPGNGQMGIVAQPGNQTIDSNRQGYALLATGNFTAGAVPVINFATSSISGGVNADRFVGRNETVTATLHIENPTVVPATNVNVQIAVASGSQVPAHLVRLNGQPAGQPATMQLGDLAGGSNHPRALQVTLLNDASIQTGQIITFHVTMTPANGLATTTQFMLEVAQKIITWRTNFEPTVDPGGPDIIVIPELDWTLRPDNPAPAANGDPFAGNWNLTTAQKAAGSTASIGDPSGPGMSYGFSTTARGAQTYDDTRYWTKKIVLPGLNVVGDKVTNPTFTQQIKAAIESYSVDIQHDFTGDEADSNGNRDVAFVRVRTYRNTGSISGMDDTGFNDETFTNLLWVDSSVPSSNGFRRYTGTAPLDGNGLFGVDAVTPDQSDVAFRIELQFQRNSITQSGEGIFFDNLALRLRVGDTAIYNAPLANQSVTVNGAGFTGFEVAPGALVSSFGTGFPAATNINAPVTALPLPTTLNGVSVRVNGVLSPLLYVGGGPQFGAPGAFQINYQLPYETTPGVAYVEVLHNDAPIASEFLNVRTSAPGLFSVASNGMGQGSVLNQNSAPNSGTQPEARDRVLQIFATGHGAALLHSLTRAPIALATGAPAPFVTSANDPLYVTSYTPTVTLGGVPAAVEYSGLAPGYVGLWQLNVRIPLNAPTGNAVPLLVTAEGRVSNAVTVAIQ